MDVNILSVNFGFNGLPDLLVDLSFTVNHNTVFGIAGSSGCGKSTLLRIISGIYQNSRKTPLSGKIIFDGDFDCSSLRKKGQIGFMFQEPSLLPNLTVKQNVYLPLQVLEHSNKQSFNADHVERIISLVGLDRHKSKLPSELSGGMKTRVALARTFSTRPALLLLDEPFSALDYGWKIDLYNQLNNLKKEHQATIILVSHDIPELFLLCDKITFISNKGMIGATVHPTSDKPIAYTADSVSEYLARNSAKLRSLQGLSVTEHLSVNQK